VGIPGRETRIEAGLCDPNLSTIVRLARALDIRACTLIEGPPPRSMD
jgi:predicted transcriptional regulator